MGGGSALAFLACMAGALGEQESICHTGATSNESLSYGSDFERGWLTNLSHVSGGCNMEVIVVGDQLSLDALAQRMATATAPLLVRGLFDHPEWRAQAAVLGRRAALTNGILGLEMIRLSVGQLLSHGPESSRLDKEKLAFMRSEWSGAAGDVLPSIELQVGSGEARPQLTVGAWLDAIRRGAAPKDAYAFHNVSGVRFGREALPTEELWRATTLARFEAGRRSVWTGMRPPALIRLGIGGSGSGAPFHDHDVIALNVGFAGRKRWLVTKPCRPNCRIPFYRGGGGGV